MLPAPIKRFIDLFSELPSVGPRQASRFAFWLIRQGPSVILEYSKSLKMLAERIGICSNCFFVFEETDDKKLCEICKDPKRDRSLLAIVEKETDLITIEKTKSYNGLYHVLGGTINPLDQDWQRTLKIPFLLERIKGMNPPITEIILALPYSARGELTAAELERVLSASGAKITRLGKGLPRGAEIEFADEETLRAALERRD